MSNLSKKTFALAAAAAFATATPLAVAPDLAPVAIAQNNQVVDVNEKATLTIDKREGEPGDATGAVEGTEFIVERVQMTKGLNTAAGWTEAGNIVNAGADEATIDTTFTAQTKATDANGKAVFTDLPVGIYKVTEKTNGNYTVAAPFLVTLPLTQDGVLNYEPTISPKNQKLDPTKAADDANANIGDEITYTIKAPVPAGDVLQDGTRTISQFRITDELQEELTYVADSAAVTLTGADDTTLDSGDYTITNDGQNLTVEFTQAGLDRLETLRADNPGLTAQVVFKAKVNAIPANGKINNTANVYVPNREDPIPTKPETDRDGDQDTNDTTTHYVNVEVTKTLNGNPVEDEKTGSGAEFEIYPCAPDGDNGYAVADGAEAIKGTATANSTELATAFTAQGGDVDSAKAAVASGFGMQLNPTVQYCAVETKAPAGYLVNPDPQLLTLTTQGTDTTRPVYTVTVNDVKDNIWGRLPATGERTMLYILALGLVLFGGGAAYQLSRRNA